MPQEEEEEEGGGGGGTINMLCVTTQKSDVVYIMAEARSLSTISLLVGEISFTRLKF
jgi:hypothetical protein